MRYLTIALMFIAASCQAQAPADTAAREGAMTMADDKNAIVLGGGCFWCLEAAFELVPGVVAVESGYAGGDRDDPSYEQVSTGLTGHAEVVRVVFDPEAVSLPTLLELFFRIHDPTTEDRQGADVGTQYRSIILYADEAQREAAEAAIRAAGTRYARPVVTDLEKLVRFWPAEEYHQDFYRKNPNYGYCRAVVAPKVEKARSFVDQFLPAKP